MKRITLAFLVLLMTFSAKVSAQGKYGKDSAECLKYLSYYKEYYKQKAYDEALPNWRMAYQLCPPTANQTMLVDGTSLMRRLIVANGKNPIYKKALIDSLLTIHKVRANAWPKNAVTSLNNMGQDLANYIKDDPARLYVEFNDIIAANQSETKPSLFLFNLQASIDLYNNGKLGAEDVINCYQRNISYLEAATPKSTSDANQIVKVRTDLETLFISCKIASCEDLIKLFTPRFEASPEDLNLVKNVVKMLSITEDCQDNDLYIRAATNMYKLDPSYNSAYFLYKLNSARGNFDAAVKYLEEAIDYPESDNITDAEYSYELATICFKNARFVKANAAARAALESDPSIAGKCYFLIGQIWGTLSCGGNEIESRAHFWVAVDNLRKAAAADESLADEANRIIAQYSRYFPQAAEAFMYNVVNGQSYTVNCGGLSATTTVRTQN